MEDRLAKIESRVAELARSLARVEDRLGKIETRLELGPTPVTGAADGTTGAAAEDAGSEVDLVGVFSLTGRTLLGLAGGYLLRAFTSGGYLPETAGAAAGLAYAGAWALLADRAGARGRPVSAVFQGVTSALVALPLIWETTVRFGILTPVAGAVALATLSGILLTVAWRRDLPALAYLVALPAAIDALFLGGSTHAPIAFTGVLLGLGAVTLWIDLAGGRGLPWGVLAWLTAAFADLAVLLLWMEDPIAEGWASRTGVLSLQLLLFAVYAGSFVAATWRGRAAAGRQLNLFAVVQTAAALAIGYGGALAVARPLPAVADGLAVAAVVLAVTAAAAALLGIERDRRSAALFLSGVAVPLLLVGSGLLLPRPAWLWALLAAAASWLAVRTRRFLLHLEAVGFAIAAAVGSGLVTLTAAAWVASASAAWPPLAGDLVLALLATAACLALPVRTDAPFWRGWDAVLEVGLWALLAAAGGALAVKLAVPLVTGEPGAGAADPAVVATVRTAVLAAAALALAAASRIRPRAALLVYPVLMAGAVKLLVQDFPAGSPATLFLALALYGGALILAPRLARLRDG